MTEKEKAQDLVNRFHQYVPLSSFGEGYPYNRFEYKRFNAKECALACVDEITTYLMEMREWNMGITFKKPELEYWNNVKIEIEKL